MSKRAPHQAIGKPFQASRLFHRSPKLIERSGGSIRPHLENRPCILRASPFAGPIEDAIFEVQPAIGFPRQPTGQGAAAGKMHQHLQGVWLRWLETEDRPQAKPSAFLGEGIEPAIRPMEHGPSDQGALRVLHHAGRLGDWRGGSKPKQRKPHCAQGQTQRRCHGPRAYRPKTQGKRLGSNPAWSSGAKVSGTSSKARLRAQGKQGSPCEAMAPHLAQERMVSGWEAVEDIWGLKKPVTSQIGKSWSK